VIDLGETKADEIPEGSWWLGLVRDASDVWHPIALAETLGRAWDAALHCPLRGDLMMQPVDPPTKRQR
jgi:hypothetical protein